MEYAAPDRVVPEAVDLGEPAGEDERANRLGGEGERADRDQQPLRRADARHGVFAAQHDEVAERRTVAEREQDERRRHHYAEAAELNQEQDHALPEPREPGARVHNDQAGHAHGRRRREERVDERNRLGRRERESQEERADDDGNDKAKGQKLYRRPRREPLSDLFDHASLPPSDRKAVSGHKYHARTAADYSIFHRRVSTVSAARSRAVALLKTTPAL